MLGRSQASGEIGRDSVTRLLFEVPILSIIANIANLITASYNPIDLIFTGRYLVARENTGTSRVAAVAITPFFILMAICTAIFLLTLDPVLRLLRSAKRFYLMSNTKYREACSCLEN